MIRFRCHCGKKMKAEEEIIGRKVKCPRCDRVAIVPKSDSLERPPDPVSDSLDEASANAKAKKYDQRRKTDASQSFESGPPTNRTSRLKINRPDFASKGAMRSPAKNENAKDSLKVASNGESVDDSLNQTEDHDSDSDGEVIELFGHSTVLPKSDELFEPQFDVQPKKPQKKRGWIPVALIAAALIGGTLVAINIKGSPRKFDSEFLETHEAQMYKQAAQEINKTNRFMTIAGNALLFDSPSSEEKKELDQYSAAITALTRGSTVLPDAEKLFKEGKKKEAGKLLRDATRLLDDRRVEVQAKLEAYRAKKQ